MKYYKFAVKFIFVCCILVSIGQLNALAETYEYDSLNRVTKTIYDDGSYTLYSYDESGNILDTRLYQKGEVPSTDQKTEQKPVDVAREIKVQSETAKYTVYLDERNESYAVVNGIHDKKKTKVSVPDTITYSGIAYPVKEIADGAFKNCKKLKQITIGKYIERIGKDAFRGDSKLKKITIKTAQLKSVGKNAFKGIHKKAVIKVPKKQLKTYQKLLRKKGQSKTVKIKK